MDIGAHKSVTGKREVNLMLPYYGMRMQKLQKSGNILCVSRKVHLVHANTG